MSELSERLQKISNGEVALCPMGRLINELDADTALALQTVLNGRAATRTIHNELVVAGIKIGRDSVSNHRNGWCRCAKVIPETNKKGK